MEMIKNRPKKSKGFLKISNECTRCGFLKPAEKEILLCLLSHIQPSGKWTISQHKLAKELNCSVSKVKRVIPDLLKKTYITSQRLGNSNTYKLDGAKNDPFLPCRWCQKRAVDGTKNRPSIGSKMTPLYRRPRTEDPIKNGNFKNEIPTETANKKNDHEGKTAKRSEDRRFDAWKEEMKAKVKSLKKEVTPT